MAFACLSRRLQHCEVGGKAALDLTAFFFPGKSHVPTGLTTMLVSQK